MIIREVHDRYINQGIMYVLEDHCVKGECVVVDVGHGILEIKNLAILPKYQGLGYGKFLIDYIAEKYKEKYSLLQVGTGDSPLTIPFYKKCGFMYSHKIENFFIDYYDHPIFEIILGFAAEQLFWLWEIRRGQRGEWIIL